MRGEGVRGVRPRGRLWALIGVVIVGVLATPAIGRELASARLLQKRAGAVRTRSLTLHGREANNTFEVRAAGADSGTYAIDGGRPERFAAIRSLTIDGVGGHDVCRIVNPRRGLFAPPGGITCNGGNRSGPRRGVLEVIGGSSASATYSPTRPGAGTLTHRLGRLVQVIRFTGLAPVTDTTPTTDYTFNAFSTNDSAELVNGPSAGELTIKSATDTFESTTISNKQNVTINATGSGDAGELDNTESETGLSSLTLNASTGISVRQTILPGVALTLNAAGGSITQAGAITLGPETLSATAARGIELSNPGNAVEFFHATAAGGPVDFNDDTSDPLNVEGVSATQDVMLSNAVGELNIASTVSSGSSSDLTLTSGAPGGTISLSGSGTLMGENVTLAADQMALAGSVQASGTATLAPYTVGRPIDLGSTQSGELGLLAADVDAVNAGALIIGDASAGPISVSASIAPAHSNSMSLEGADGFSATASGSLSVPTLALLDEGSTPRTWTITPASVTDGSAPAIPYAGAGNLAVTGGSGGDTFEVTGSVSTTLSLDGGTLANGTLNYNAQGRAVSGSFSPPTGVIDSPTVEPVRFTRMAGVKIINGAPTLNVTVKGSGTVIGTGGIDCLASCSQTYPPGTVVTLTGTPASGSSFAGWSGGGCSGTVGCTITMSSDQSVTATFAKHSAPVCVLKAPTSNVSLARSHKRKTPPATLRLSVKCNQTARATLTGTITELLRAKSKHHKAATKTVHISSLRLKLAARVTKLLVLTLPRSARSALTSGIKESASFTLAAANANGNSRATVAIRRLKLKPRKRRR